MLSPLSIAQANNDWLEVALMAGLPGVVLLAFAVVLWLARARALLFAKSHGLQFSRLGLLIILFFGLASLTDYPLRVPSISCLIVVAALWCVMRQDEATAMRPSDRPGR
jgi:O-antigen ligase